MGKQVCFWRRCLTCAALGLALGAVALCAVSCGGEPPLSAPAPSVSQQAPAPSSSAGEVVLSPAPENKPDSWEDILWDDLFTDAPPEASVSSTRQESAAKPSVSAKPSATTKPASASTSSAASASPTARPTVTTQAPVTTGGTVPVIPPAATTAKATTTARATSATPSTAPATTVPAPTTVRATANRPGGIELPRVEF